MINCTYGLCPVWDDGRGSWRRLLIDWRIMPADGGESILRIDLTTLRSGESRGDCSDWQYLDGHHYVRHMLRAPFLHVLDPEK